MAEGSGKSSSATLPRRNRQRRSLCQRRGETTARSTGRDSSDRHATAGSGRWRQQARAGLYSARVACGASAAPAAPPPRPKAGASRTLNINVGVLGHVDSGKTSLTRALSTVGSTASFDKHPQSKERGITLDLGFSSFLMELPPHLKEQGYDAEYDQMQITLVDCPGHASLIRTIIGGAQIIDMMMLVVDLGKGIQTQTAECLVIGEITNDTLIVVLNKLDVLPADGRDKELDKMKGASARPSLRPSLPTRRWSPSRRAPAAATCTTATAAAAAATTAAAAAAAAAAAGRRAAPIVAAVAASNAKAPPMGI